MIVCAGGSEEFKFATPIGVGVIDSTINLVNLLSQNLQNELIFIGTAGLYRDGEILEIYESKFAFQHEISELGNHSYTPINGIICPNVSRETIVVNSSNFITKDEVIADKFANLGYFMENMEFFSVTRVANFFKIPVRGIFCATNFCNKFAHQDFIKNHAKAKENLEIYVREKGLI